MKKLFWVLVYTNFIISILAVFFLFIYAIISVATSFNEPVWMDGFALIGVGSLVITSIVFGVGWKEIKNAEDWETINNGID